MTNVWQFAMQGVWQIMTNYEKIEMPFPWLKGREKIASMIATNGSINIGENEGMNLEEILKN